MDQQKIRQLLRKYVTEGLDEEEKTLLADAIAAADDTVFQDVMQEHEGFVFNAVSKRGSDDELFERTRKKIAVIETTSTLIRKTSRIRYWAAAAAVLLVVVTGAWIYLQQLPTVKRAGSTSEIAAATSKATLTLGNGAVVELDSAGNQLIPQGGTSVQQRGGLLVYNSGDADVSVSINTLTTPRGGQFKVQLPDGSRAWLNAASSLRYPTAFRGVDRSVEVTGEVYFEVAANASAPFIVHVKDKMQVKVLGTDFNINAYEDDHKIYTTLLAGRVQVYAQPTNSYMDLRPSQQAVFGKNANLDLNKAVDIEQVMAWKNSIFYFEDAELRQVMTQLSRWYDVDVTYEPGIGQQHFSGKLPRDLELSQLLSVLDMSEIRYRIEGRKLIIKPAGK